MWEGLQSAHAAIHSYNRQTSITDRKAAEVTGGKSAGNQSLLARRLLFCFAFIWIERFEHTWIFYRIRVFYAKKIGTTLLMESDLEPRI